MPKLARVFSTVTAGFMGEPTNKIIAHPGEAAAANQLNNAQTILAIGPEGGFVDNEVALFCSRVFTQVQLGERILRVETAIPVLLAKLF